MVCFKWKNQTTVSEFLLLEFSYHQNHQLIFIMLFIMLYLFSLAGNSFILVATNLNPHLHTPMYFFICNLSIVDLCMTSVTVPKYLINNLSGSFSISFIGCFIQMFLFLWLVSTESFLLAVMAYDRYVAICKPLHYTLLMTQICCVVLVGATWMLASLHTLVYVGMTFLLCFCGPNTINSFYCEQPLVLELSCSDTSITKMVLLYEGSVMAFFNILLIFSSYAWIISFILRLPTALARKKAFFTCSSHLTVIALFYGTGGSAYLPHSAASVGNNTMVGVMYALVIPVLNPVIYSLRNKEMKATFKHSLGRKCCLKPSFQVSH